jgi:hypothetical protein
MRVRVARHRAEWSIAVPLTIDHDMLNEMPQTFARRARLSSKAIIVAIALTLAAVLALAITSRDKETTAVKTVSPVTHAPLLDKSVLVPVVNR